MNETLGIKGGAKKLARLTKAWKYYRNAPISSFYLAIRAAEYMKTQSTFVSSLDMYYFLLDLEGHELASMKDPQELTSRIKATSSDAKRSDALSKLETAVGRARKPRMQRPMEMLMTPSTTGTWFSGGKFPAR